MKNDTIKCAWCSTDFEPASARAKFCSEACKQKNKRKQVVDKQLADRGLPPTVQASKLEPKPTPSPYTEAQLRIQRETGKPIPGSPEWYVHGTPENPNQTWDRVCVKCGEKYTTTLSLMRFCSQVCKDDVMVVIANGPHKNYRG